MEDNAKYTEQDVIRLMEEMADAAPNIPTGLGDEMLGNIKRRKKALDARVEAGGVSQPAASVQEASGRSNSAQGGQSIGADVQTSAKTGGKLLAFRSRRAAAILSAAAAFVLLLGGILYSHGTLFGSGVSAFMKSEPFIPEIFSRAESTADPAVGADPFTYPLTAAAYMEITGECGCVWNHGGFLISADTLLSSPDCLTCPEHGSAAVSVEFFFGYRNKRNSFLDYDGEWEVLTGEKDDVSCIRLAEKAGDTTGWFGTLWNLPDSGAASGSWLVCGYTESGLAVSEVALEKENSSFFRCKAGTVPGPGYPVYNSDAYVIGVTVTGKNGDTIVRRMDDDIRKAADIE